MDLEIIILSELSQIKTNLYDLTYLWYLKNNTSKSIHKTETDLQTYYRMQTYGHPKGKRDGGGIN